MTTPPPNDHGSEQLADGRESGAPPDDPADAAAPGAAAPRLDASATVSYLPTTDGVPSVEPRSGGTSLEFDLESIVGESPALRDALDRARKVAASRLTTVLLVGETGT